MNDIFFMKKAYALAQRAEKIAEVPVGAVIVKDGKVLLGPNEEDSQIKVKDVPDGTPVYLSFRSESVILDDKSPLRAKVVLTSVMGKEIITSFILAGKEVRGYMNSDVELQRDQEIGIRFKKTGVFVFDRESGDRYL